MSWPPYIPIILHRGVVLDLDHAISVDEEGAPSPDYSVSAQDRTGTVPFKALDLHCPLERDAEDAYPNYHLPRYDLESFIWVFIWLLHETNKSHPRGQTIMDQWNDFSPTSIRRNKESLIQDYASHKSSSKIREHCLVLEPLMLQLLGLLRVALENSDPKNQIAKAERQSWPAGPTLWYHTLGGRFTVENLLDILETFQLQARPVS